jgi:hypothetical protein
MKLKRAIASMIILAVGILAGCSWLSPVVDVALEWIPNTSNNGMTHWLPGIYLKAMVVPEPDLNLGHQWIISWGDGLTDEWDDNSHSQLSDGVRDVYPWGNSRIAIGHRYRTPGIYPITVSYNGVIRGHCDLPVELQKTRATYHYNENGETVEDYLRPWEPS